MHLTLGLYALSMNTTQTFYVCVGSTIHLTATIMPKDKYLSIFLCQIETIVFIILQIFFFCNMHGFENWEISLGRFLV